MEYIEELKKRGFSDGAIDMFKKLDLDTARRMFTDLMSLTDEQVFRFNYYEQKIRGSHA